MNLVVFKADELLPGGVIRLTGDRAVHIIQVLGATTIGQELRVGLIGGKIGKGRVAGVWDDVVELAIGELTEEPVKPTIDLILALPRPQMLKRILENAATLGLRRLFIIRSNRVERSFFSSPVLTPEILESHLRIGMEQGMTTCLPDVQIFDRFKEFTEDKLPELVKDIAFRIVAHPDDAVSFKELDFSTAKEKRPQVVVAIGPEGGWLDYEVEVFEAKGFKRCHLGERVLRVETAVYSALSRIEFLYEVFS